VVGQIQQFLDSDTAPPKLADARTLLATALADLQAMAAAMTGYLLSSQENARELYRLGLESVRFLLAVGDLLIGWLVLQQAEIVLNALDSEVSDRDRWFYAGKVAVANFFAKNVLPRLTADRKIVEAVDLTAMDLREEAF
jgi:Acetyl-CoA dehydrogenase C-terminal like